jgi:hypothetical protein
MSDRLSRDELVALMRLLQRAEGTEEEQDAWLALVERHVPDPEVSDLIYHSPVVLSPEEIVDRALVYKPIIAGPAVDSSCQE